MDFYPVKFIFTDQTLQVLRKWKTFLKWLNLLLAQGIPELFAGPE